MCAVPLCRHVFQYILGGAARVHWHDLAFFDPVLYESLRQVVVDPSLLETADLTFTINTTADEVSYRAVPPLIVVYSYP